MDTIRTAARELGSKRLIASYILDWVVIIVFAAAGGLLSFVRPKHRAFSLVNQNISFPYVDESITIWMLGVVGLVAPAIIIALITLIWVPGAEARRMMTRSQVLRLKLWEVEKGVAGLCLSQAVAFFITQGMKNMFGKPRPNLLSRSCLPDLSDVAGSVVGAYGQGFNPQWVLVDSSICTQGDDNLLQDGFRSFPSGHSSWSWGGLLYLTLFLCSKFAIGLPHLPQGFASQQRTRRPTSEHELLPLHNGQVGRSSLDNKFEDGLGTNGANERQVTTSNPLALRNAAAAPPNYLILPALTPVAVAVYISATRYSEYYHFGFDIFFGSMIGIATSWLAFRWYHLPLGPSGMGWAWGARSKHRAFAIGVGTGGYVGDEGWHSTKGGQTELDLVNRA